VLKCCLRAALKCYRAALDWGRCSRKERATGETPTDAGLAVLKRSGTSTCCEPSENAWESRRTEGTPTAPPPHRDKAKNQRERRGRQRTGNIDARNALLPERVEWRAKRVLHGARAEMPVKLWMRGGPLHDEGYPRRANVGGKGGGGGAGAAVEAVEVPGR